MLILDMTWIRIKQVFREKEFYFYVIGFPLFFLILFGFLSSTWVPKVDTMEIGWYSEDTSIRDPLTNTSLRLDTGFVDFLNNYTNEAGVKTFEIKHYDSLKSMDNDIKSREIRGGVHLPSNFSEEAGKITRFYASMILVQTLSDQYPSYPGEATNITAAINKLQPYLQISATLNVIFRGDITVQTTMEAYTGMWQILVGYLNNYTVSHANDIWFAIKTIYELSFDIEIDSDTLSDSSIDYNIQLVSAGDGSVLQDFRREYLSNLIPGQIIASIMTASVSAIWMLDRENTTGLLKRMKLTKLSSAQYLGSILLAWSIIAIIQGLFLLSISAILGFFNFGINPLGWIFMLTAMVLLGIISATFALLIGSFANARIASPFMIMIFSTIHMFVGEYFFQVEPAFTFAGKNFTGFDFIPIRPAFLVMRNGILLDSASSLENLWFDLLLLFLWAILIFTIGAFLFNKFKLKYAEEN